MDRSPGLLPCLSMAAVVTVVALVVPILAGPVPVAGAASPPVVTGLDPSFGPTAGGTDVTITGTGFNGANAVHFGGTSALSFTVESSTTIDAVSPSGSGTVDLTVTTPRGGESTPTTADRYSYTASDSGSYNCTVPGWGRPHFRSSSRNHRPRAPTSAWAERSTPRNRPR